MEKGIDEVTKDETIKTESEEATFETDSQATSADAGTGDSESLGLSEQGVSDSSGEEIPDSDNFMKLYEESLKSIQKDFNLCPDFGCQVALWIDKLFNGNLTL